MPKPPTVPDMRQGTPNVPPPAAPVPKRTIVGRPPGTAGVDPADTARLQKVRDSAETGEPIEWVRVHQVPDHVFFDHSVHLAAGVGCVTCHGRVDQMEVVQVDQPLSMGWCLDCHRDPGPNLRPRNEITNMDWAPDENWVAHVDEVNPPTHCSGCHR